MSIPECFWLAIFRITRATFATRLRWITSIIRIQPIHVDTDVIPERYHKNHATVQGLPHGFQTTLLGEIILVTE